MPATVRESLLSRARSMGEAALTVLQLAAVAGEHIDVAVLTRAAGRPANEVEDAVRDGLRLQLLVERRDGRRTAYAFRHDLTREALADEVIGPERQRLHLRLAEAMLTVHADDLDSVAPELADHFTHAGEIERAIEFGVRAARLAASSYALEEAGRRYDAALRLLRGEPGQRLALLSEAATALIEAPDPRLAMAIAAEARDLARQQSDPAAEARALLALEQGMWQLGESQKSLSLLEEALRLVAGRDEVQEARVLGRLTRMLVLADHQAEAADRLPAAIELASRIGDYAALSRMHGTEMMLAEQGPRFAAAFEAATSAAQMSNDRNSERNLNTNAGFICLWCGNFGAARQSFLRAIDLYERFAPHDRYAVAGYSWLLSLVGEYEEAKARAEPLRGVAAIPTRVVALTALYEVLERQGSPEASELVGQLWSAAVGTGESQRSVPAMAVPRPSCAQPGRRAGDAPFLGSPQLDHHG